MIVGSPERGYVLRAEFAHIVQGAATPCERLTAKSFNQ